MMYPISWRAITVCMPESQPRGRHIRSNCVELTLTTLPITHILQVSLHDVALLCLPANNDML